MKGYAANRFPREALEVWSKATSIVKAFVEYPGETLRCHEVARAVFAILASGHLGPFVLTAHGVDGWYAGADHSWIELRPGLVLDPYAVARVPMVQLVDTHNALLQSGHYREETPRTDIRIQVMNRLIYEGKRHASFASPGLHHGGWRNRVRELMEAIRKHRDQSGDDRCFLDDYDLYSVLPEGFDKERLRLHDPVVMKANCDRFIQLRHDPVYPYISPQRELEKLEKQAEEAKAELDYANGCLRRIGNRLEVLDEFMIEYDQEWQEGIEGKALTSLNRLEARVKELEAQIENDHLDSFGADL